MLRYGWAWLSLLGLVVAWPAVAWTPRSQEVIAREAARLVPPDLYRQLVKHRGQYVQGSLDPFQDREPAHHVKNEDGGGRLDEMIFTAADNAIRAIESHQPFSEIAYRLGEVAHYVADADNPLNTSESDPQEQRFIADYVSYMELVEPSVKAVFYGIRPAPVGQDLRRMVADILAESRKLYPLVGREYRRVSFRSGLKSFDERSTAYAVAALAFNHAINDIAEVLRYIWLEAGGIDSRQRLPVRGNGVQRLSRKTARR